MELAWPQYEVAPSDTVFALGVVSINYARFERTNVWMIAAVANMREPHAAVMSARTNATDRVKLIESYLLQSKWPADVETAIRHYMKAMGILITNRNILIHSNIIRGTQDRSAIYSVNRQGNTSLFQAPSLKSARSPMTSTHTFTSVSVSPTTSPPISITWRARPV